MHKIKNLFSNEHRAQFIQKKLLNTLSIILYFIPLWRHSDAIH